MKRSPATKTFIATMIFLLVLIVCADGKIGNNSEYDKKSCKEGPKSSADCAPTPEPTLAPTSQPTQEDVRFTFENETIKFINVANVPGDDIDSLFVIQKEWLENYFREQGRRWMQRRGLQDRRRDSRDITTEFEFVAQDVTNSTDGKPTNEVTYNQVIGFVPSRRRLIENKH